MTIPDPSSNWEQSIALWGPTGSGKTWLIQALNQELKWYSQHDPEFHYRMTDSDGRFLSVMAPEPKPTPRIEDRLWRFAREPKKDTKAHRISAHAHQINVHDDKGASLVDAVYSPGQNPLTEITLQTADSLLVLLDPTLVQGSLVAQPATSGGSLYTQRQYTYLVQALLEKVAETQEERYVAACLTKVDRMDLQRDAWQYIHILFGPDMVYLLQNSGQGVQTQAFATSAVGFYLQGGKTHSNYDDSSGQVRYPDRWKPFNVAAPFFWLFENVEKQRLKKTPNVFLEDRLKYYIGYPPPLK